MGPNPVWGRGGGSRAEQVPCRPHLCLVPRPEWADVTREEPVEVERERRPSPELTEPVREGRGKLRRSLFLSAPLLPSPTLSPPLLSSLCPHFLPACRSLQLPHFCGNFLPGPNQCPRAPLPLAPGPLHLLTPVVPGTLAAPAPRAPGLAVRLSPPSDVFTLPLLAARHREPHVGLSSPLGWLCSPDCDGQQGPPAAAAASIL